MCKNQEKCATIFRRSKGNYSFVCFYCCHIFESGDQIIGHIEAVHYHLADEDNKEVPRIVIKDEPAIEFLAFPAECKLDDDEDNKSSHGNSSGTSNHIPQEWKPTDDFDDSYAHHDDALSDDPGNVEEKKINAVKSGNSFEKPFKCELSGGTDVYCDVCKKSFRDKTTLTFHLLHHVKSKYRCDICFSSFVHKKSLENHHLVHGRLYKCEMCDREFKKKSNMKKHLQLVHLKLELFVCEICARTFKYSRSYIEHKRKHTGERPFKCDFDSCDKSFTTTKQKRLHVNVHHLARTYTCEHCKKKFKYELYLKKHIREEHSERTFKCNLCEFTAKQRSLLKKHSCSQIAVTVFVCNICTGSFKSKAGLEKHMMCKHTEKPTYECLDCHRIFKSIGILNTHKKQMHSTEMHVCDSCGKSFKCERYLKNHYETKHSLTPRSYKCDVCNMSLKSKSSLAKHHQNMHSNEEHRYVCDQCSQTFKHKETYMHHVRMHTGEKPFQCNACGKLYYTNSVLRKHIKEAHPTETFGCDKCDKIFHSKNRLRVHLLTHGTELLHECDICFKRFKCRKYLRDHKVIHSEVKRYQCRYCDMRFVLLSGQKRHERSRH